MGTKRNIAGESAGLDRPWRIAHVAERLIVAGEGNVIASLLRQMPRAFYQSSLWCVDEADDLGCDLQNEGQEVVTLGRRSRRDFGLFVRIAHMVRTQQIDILHCHDELSWFYGVIGGRLGGVGRVVVTMHGRRADISSRHLWEQRFLAKLTTKIIVVSDHLRHQIIREMRVPPHKVVLIRNGVTLQQVPQMEGFESFHTARLRLGIPEDAFVVGSVGRLATVKNFTLLLEAATDVAKIVPELRVVLIGEGPCRQQLEQRVMELSLKDNVVFTGIRKDVPEVLPGLDLYVCSSDYEGISLSVLEAMVAERAIIATAVGGNTELIQSNETGLLIGRGDRAALSEAILSLYYDKERRRQLGLEARRRVESNWSIDRMIEQYDRLYQGEKEV